MESTPRTPISTKIEQPDDHLALPGAGLPLDHTPEALNLYGVKTRSLFPTVLDDRDIERGYIEYVKLCQGGGLFIRGSLLTTFKTDSLW
jgi:hypothetical protein